MTNTIGAKLTEIVNPIVPLYFAEAEVDSYPYAAYEMTTEPVWTKDSIHHLAAEVEVKIYAGDFATASLLAGRVRTAVCTSMRSDQYSARLLEEENTCEDAVWVFQQTYRINQYF